MVGEAAAAQAKGRKFNNEWLGKTLREFYVMFLIGILFLHIFIFFAVAFNAERRKSSKYLLVP